MDGPDNAKQILVDYLTATVPGRIADIEQRRGWTVGTIPRPAHYGSAEEPIPQRDNQWPAVIVVGGDMRRQVFTDSAGEAPLKYFRTYGIQAWVWARGATRDQTSRRRDTLILAVVEVVLSDLNLGSDTASVDPVTLHEWYGDIAAMGELPRSDRAVAPRSQRTITTGMVDLEVSVEEALPDPVLSDPPTGLTVELFPAVELLEG